MLFTVKGYYNMNQLTTKNSTHDLHWRNLCKWYI